MKNINFFVSNKKKEKPGQEGNRCSAASLENATDQVNHLAFKGALLEGDLLPKNGIFYLMLFVLGLWQQLHAQTPPANFSSMTVSSQWNGAVGLCFDKSGSHMFVWEKGGKVWVVENNQKQLLLDISEEVGGWRDFGLLGFALHPQFETNGHFFLLYTVDRHHLNWHGTSSYSATKNEYFNATIGRLTRYTAVKSSGGFTVDPNSRKILLGATKSTGIPSLHESHGIGSLVFGTDGTLLISAGDGASYSSLDGGSAAETYFAQALTDGIITSQENVGAFRSQLLESYNGKILRIDPETGNGIPSNPFYETANPGSVRSKVWALGLRNPFRMTLKPNSGSINPADGKPGVLYAGDVGLGSFEDLNAVTKGGMNFGWPVFEGLTHHSGYADLKRFNYYAPNPLYGVNGCTQQYFYFQDLIAQETASGTATFSNPCNTSQSIPSSVKTFMHSRPIIDMAHSNTGPARTGIFSGETAAVINIGAAGSPVAGPQFGGNSAIAGIFYPHNDFPAEFRNTLFFGDYARQWIRNITVDGYDKPVEVRNFINSGAVVVAMATHPTESGLYYIHYPSEIRKVSYNSVNHPPIAVASANKTFGPGPLAVQFTGSASSDPDGQPLTYHWDFGDGSSSALINPSHTFTTATSAPTMYTVTLTVIDSQGSTAKATLNISVNNTPPKVTITSPADYTKYPLDRGSINYSLRATVSDQEHTDSQLSYRWQTILHHNTHEHPESYVSSRETTTTISPLGCGEDTFYYRITLRVTDAAGLSTTEEIKLYPDCSTVPGPILREYWANVSGYSVSDIPVNTVPTSTSYLTLFEGPTNVADNYGARIRAYVQAPVSGDYVFWIASDNNGELWLSSDNNPANKRRIAHVNGWTSSREWNKYSSQKSEIIRLQAGQKYYIEALHIEGAGGDNLAVGWQLPDGHFERPISGTRLYPFEISGRQPTVAITYPENNAVLAAPANISITASASDADGFVSKVEFFSGTAKLGEDTDGSNGWSYAWNSVPAGTYSLTARATDNGGSMATSAVINFSVTGASSLAAPSNLIATGVSSSQINLSWQDNSPDEDGFVLERATKSDFSGSVAKINLRANATSYEDRNKTTGIVFYYRIKAVKGSLSSAYSNVGSAAATSNGTPFVAITSPANNATYTAPANISITASASDADGFVSRVEFFNGTVKLGEDTDGSNGWSYAWNSVPAGTYSLTARATDNGGSMATSAVINLSVTGTSSLAAPSNLIATGVSSSQINLSWQDNSPDEDGFVLERATKSDFSGSVAKINLRANATSYEDRNKTTGVLFYYRIKAMKGSLSSAYSLVASAAATASGATISQLSAYPNTFNEFVDLKFLNAESVEYEVTVYDLLGRVFYENTFMPVSDVDFVHRIDLSDPVVGQGVYLIRVENKEKDFREIIRIVKIQ